MGAFRGELSSSAVVELLLSDCEARADGASGEVTNHRTELEHVCAPEPVALMPLPCRPAPGRHRRPRLKRDGNAKRLGTAQLAGGGRPAAAVDSQGTVIVNADSANSIVR